MEPHREAKDRGLEGPATACDSAESGGGVTPLGPGEAADAGPNTQDASDPDAPDARREEPDAFVREEPPPELPVDESPEGEEAREANETQAAVTCDADTPCMEDEVCNEGVCEVERCVQSFASAPPLGSSFPLRNENEVVTIGWNVFDGYTLHSWDVQNGDLSGHAEITTIAGDPVDLVGAQIGDERPEALIVISEDDTSLTVLHPAYGGRVGLGLQPIAVAAGDVDGAAHEEALAIAEDGNWVFCHLNEVECQGGELPGHTVLDAAAGDVDGDGRAELVVIGTDAAGEDVLVVVHPVQGPAESPYDTYTPEVVVDRISVADLDGDGVAEIVGLEYGDALDLVRDGIMTWALGPEGLEVLYSGTSGDYELADIEAGDIDASGAARLLMITDDEEALIGTWSGVGWDFTGWLNAAPDNGDANYQVSLADMDGDALLGRLSEGPAVLPASVVPIAVLHYPPYNALHAEGKASVAFGEVSGSGSSTTDSVGLSLKGTVGISTPMIDASVKTTVTAKIGRKVKTASSYKVVTQYKASAKPSIHGNKSAAVVLGWGCFHGYTYEVDDPRGLATNLDADNELMVSIPVGGGTTAWSSARYDAVIELREQGTPIDVPHTVGDPFSYPASPVDGEGLPLDEADLIFPLSELIVSDVAAASWKLEFTESMTQETSLGAGIEVSAGLNAPGFIFGVGAGVSTSTAYAVTAKAGVRFEGAVPPIPDDPATPEDEYAMWRYGFTPYFYQREMVSSEGEPVTVFVADYTVR